MTYRTSPVAIGGLGGSGTRVFAESLRQAGLAIGQELNTPLDNLWFTILFKRAIWARHIPDPTDIAISVGLFRRAMTTGLQGHLSPSEQALLDRLRADLPPDGSWHCGAKIPHADSLIASGPQPGGQGKRWGWKEPNTHLFLPQLDHHMPGLRYIHIVRDGLDMAFSANTWQAKHWAHHYGLRQAPGTKPLPLDQLRYWVTANARALNYGQAQMPGRFLVMDYDEFCARPRNHWPRLQRFLGQPVDTPIPDGLISPSTIGRSLSQDLSIFPDTLLKEVQALQSRIETLTQKTS